MLQSDAETTRQRGRWNAEKEEKGRIMWGGRKINSVPRNSELLTEKRQGEKEEQSSVIKRKEDWENPSGGGTEGCGTRPTESEER